MRGHAKDIIRGDFALYFGAKISEVSTVIIDSKAGIQNPLMNLQTRRNSKLSDTHPIIPIANVNI